MDPAWAIGGDRAGRNRANLGCRGVARAVDRAVDTVRLSDARKVVPLHLRQSADPVNVQPCWTVPELAAYLQVTRRTVTAWIRQGRLRAHRLSTTVTVIEPSEVDRFLAAHATGGQR